MKTLITAADIKKIADCGDKTIVVPPKAIITPAARDAARDYGVSIVVQEGLQMEQPASQPTSQTKNSMPVSAELIAQIVQEVLAAIQGGQKGGLDKVTDPSGMRLVRGDSVVLDEYPTGYPQDKVTRKAVFTAQESPHLSAGFMNLEDTSFTTELRYEQVVHVLDGTVECMISGRKYLGRTGDTFYLPANTKITLATMSKVKLFYVTYPAK